VYKSGNIVFVVCALNIQCILHQSCPMKTQHFTQVLLNIDLRGPENNW